MEQIKVLLITVFLTTAFGLQPAKAHEALHKLSAHSLENELAIAGENALLQGTIGFGGMFVANNLCIASAKAPTKHAQFAKLIACLGAAGFGGHLLINAAESIGRHGDVKEERYDRIRNIVWRVFVHNAAINNPNSNEKIEAITEAILEGVPVAQNFRYIFLIAVILLASFNSAHADYNGDALQAGYEQTQEDLMKSGGAVLGSGAVSGACFLILRKQKASTFNVVTLPRTRKVSPETLARIPAKTAGQFRKLTGQSAD